MKRFSLKMSVDVNWGPVGEGVSTPPTPPAIPTLTIVMELLCAHSHCGIRSQRSELSKTVKCKLTDKPQYIERAYIYCG